MTDLPAPIVSEEVDVAKLDGFMLDTVKLLGSELVALSTGDEFKAAVMLWCRAWKQRPACSLPDDDRILASFAGVTISKWRRIREMALRGFKKCSDGRLYHPVLAEDAVRADKARRQRQDAIRKRWDKSDGSDTGSDTKPPTGPIRPNERPNASRNTADIPSDARDGTGRDGTGIKERSSTTGAVPEADAVVVAFHELRDKHWPSESRLPAPRMTIRREVEDLLERGAPAALILEVLDREMARGVADGKGAPGSLKAYSLSLGNALASYRKPMPEGQARPAGNGYRNGSKPHPLGPAEKLEWRRKWGLSDRATRSEVLAKIREHGLEDVWIFES